MTIHLRPIAKPRIKADTRALMAARTDTHRKLRMEIEEERISADQVDKHNRHLRRSRELKAFGEAFSE